MLAAAVALAAQDARRLSAPVSSAPARRLALVVGNDAYAEVPLRNARNDAQALAAALRGVGFADVAVLTDTRLRTLSDGVDAFIARLRAGDVAFFFYSGHGFAVEGDNYLVPVDFTALDAADAKWQAYPVGRVQARMEGAGARLAILVLDACRNNPFRAVRAAGGGWTGMLGGTGTYIAFATAPGQTASDNPAGANGLFTTQLLSVMAEPGLTVAEVFDRVGRRVQAASGGRQTPWVSAVAGVGQEVVFRAAATTPAAQAAPASGAAAPDPDLARREELSFWESVKDSRNVALLQEYLRQYRAGRYRVIAEARMAELRAGPTTASPQASSAVPPASRPPIPGPSPAGGTSAPRPLTLQWDAATSFTFVPIPPGSFLMGSENGDAVERPVHRVTITQGFEVGATQVTQAQWMAAMGTNPSAFKGSNLPVENVSWDDVQQFLARLNARRDGYAYRLPTEAEWEYAARAGTPGDYAGDLDALAWYGKNAGGKPHAVGTKQPNGWGLYDMHGNVREWVGDWYGPYPSGAVTDPRGPSPGTSRVFRGGSWSNSAWGCRSAYRYGDAPGYRSSVLGFRVLRGQSH